MMYQSPNIVALVAEEDSLFLPLIICVLVAETSNSIKAPHLSVFASAK